MEQDTMAHQRSPGEGVGSDSVASVRERYPSGWCALVRHESVGAVLDVLMDTLPSTEFTKTELAADADISRQSLYTHWDLLLALDVIAPVEGSSPQRYRVAHDSDLLELLHEVDGTVNRLLGDRDTSG